MTNKEKFIEVFGEEIQRQYPTKSWWEQEYVPPITTNLEDAILNGIKKTCDDCIYSFVIPGVKLKECEKRWMHVDKTEHMNETCPDFKEEKE